MTEPDFLASRLSSRQLLALLCVCESARKGSEDLDGFLSTFADRLGNLGEDLRAEVLGAHLMSVEDLDVYDDGALQRAIDDNRPLWEKLTTRLDADPRFANA